MYLSTLGCQSKKMLTPKSVDLINILVLEIFSLFCKVALKNFVLPLTQETNERSLLIISPQQHRFSYSLGLLESSFVDYKTAMT